MKIFRNFGKENRTESEGSSLDSLETLSENYPVQVVGFVPLAKEERARITLDPVTLDCPNRKKVRIHIPTGTDYFSPDRALEIFYSCMEGKAKRDDDPLRELYTSKEARIMQRYIWKSDMDKALDVTNLSEIKGIGGVYTPQGHILKELSEADLIIQSGGTFERVKDYLKKLPSTFDKKGNLTGPRIIVSTSEDNSAALNLFKNRRIHNNRLGNGGFATEDLGVFIRDYAMNDRYDIRMMVADRQDMEDGLAMAAGLAKNNQVFGDMRADLTGSVSFSALSKKNCLNDKGLFFPHVYSYEGDSELHLEKNPMPLTADDRKLKVVVVNTGCADQTELRYLSLKAQNDRLTQAVVDLYRRLEEAGIRLN